MSEAAGEVMMHDPIETLRAYVTAFETLNPEAVLAFYHLPCMFIAPFGVSLVTDADAARHIASALIEHARSQGYRRTEVSQIHHNPLAANLVSVSGEFVRFGTGDQEIGRFGFTYVMRDEGAGWSIVVAVAHDVPQANE